MAPLNETENIRIDLIEAEALDLRQRWVTICMVETRILTCTDNELGTLVFFGSNFHFNCR